MHLNKFRISSEATAKLRVLRQRATLTPNLLCRMAMAASFELGSIGPVLRKLEEGQEFNAYTLFGVDQPLYTTMLRMLEEGDGTPPVDEADLVARLRAHIDRGVAQLSVRIKTPSDAARLLAGRSA